LSVPTATNWLKPHVVATQVEGDSLLIGRHIRHSAFSLADTYSIQSEEQWVGQ
jgi:hypothetical protein